MALARLLRLTLALLPLAGGAALAAPPAPEPAGSSSLSRSVVELRLKEIESSDRYDAEAKSSLEELYNRTLSNLEKARTDSAAAELFKQTRKTAVEEAAQLRSELKQARQLDRPVGVDITADTSTADIEQLLLREKADYAAVEARLSSLEDLLARESARPEETRSQLTEARTQLETLNTSLEQPQPAGDASLLTEARRWSRLSHRKALTAEIDKLDQELLSHAVRLELTRAQRDVSRRELQRIGERVGLLENMLGKQRRAQAREAVAEAASEQGETGDKPALVREFAARNATYSDTFLRLTESLEETVTASQKVSAKARRIEDDFRSTRQKLEVAGLSQALGQILLEQRRLLPDEHSIRRDALQAEKQVAEAAFRQIQYSEELEQLQDLETFVEAQTATLDEDEARAIQDDLIELAGTRRELLQQVVATSNSYLRALGELDYAQASLLTVVTEFDEFLAERLLWVRSGSPPDIAMLLRTPTQVLELLAPDRWLDVLSTLLERLQHSAWSVVLLVLAAALLARKRNLVRWLEDTGKKTARLSTDSFHYSLQGLGATLLLALPGPLLLWTLGWMLVSSLNASDFSRSVGGALMLISPAFLYLSAFRGLCRKNGVACVHFRWPDTTTQRLRRQITVLMSIFLPAAVIAIITFRMTTQVEGALARIAFVVFVGALSWFFWRLLGTRDPILDTVIQRSPDSLLARYRYLWLVLALTLPLLLIGLAVSGFLYTAGTLTGSLVQTLWLALGFLVFQQLAVRWLLLTNRKLAFQAALERRRAMLAERSSGDHPESATALYDETELDEPEVDLGTLNQESLKLLNNAILFGLVLSLWFVWSDVLPAFGHLEHIDLWHYTGFVDGDENLVPVTLADALLALLVIVITVAAVKRFPALLEILLLKRFASTSGGRYAASTLSRYAIAAVGALLVLNTLGVRWSQVQWMAAALSVGIGFGLQEIVANFISGLIILVERPIRVGDVVTVGDADGVVTRIQIRATTIRTWDRMELLVPNKEFITGRLLNWSLSDPITRITVPVGVAYGSDVQRAMTLMRETAEADTKVLSDPPPYTLFTQFGDNTLNLELRCFVGALEDRLQTITRLHETVNQRFNEAGIVIAFPQRDVHLNTSQPLDVRIQPQS